MLYSEKEWKKRLAANCTLFYFYGSEEAVLQNAAKNTIASLSGADPEITTLPGPTPTVEQIVPAAGTISLFGTRRVVYMPLLKASAYSDRDLNEICSVLSDAENAVFVMTSLLEEQRGRIRPGKREQKLIAVCEKIGYCVQIGKPGRSDLLKMVRDWAAQSGAQFARGADAALLDLCGEEPFRLQNEVEKLAALANYGTVTTHMVKQLACATLEADTFEMVRLAAAGRTAQAMEKLNTLLALQNDPNLVCGALAGNYLDMYRALLTGSSGRKIADMAKDFGYTGKWDTRLRKSSQAAERFTRRRLEQSLAILLRLNLDLKSSRLDSVVLLQKALCELAMVRNSA